MEKLKAIIENSQKNLENKFIRILENKDKTIDHKSRALFFYNLLNNANKMFCENLEKLVSDAVDGNYDHGVGNASQTDSWALVELILKPMLRQVFNKAIMDIANTADEETRNTIVMTLQRDEKVENSNKIIVNESNNRNKSKSKIGKDGKRLSASNLEYPLVRLIENKLELPSNYLTMEVIMMTFILNDNASESEKILSSVESHIRIAAAKLLLAYERVKHFYNLPEMKADELKNAEKLAQDLSKFDEQ